MEITKTNAAAITICLLMAISIVCVLSPAKAQVAPARGSTVPTYAFLNIAPNPAGIGQTVTLGIFLSAPLPTSELPTNITVVETNPAGTTVTLGPFTGDTTGGTYTTIIPNMLGNWTLQMFYSGQPLSDGATNGPSQSLKQTLVVQQNAIPLSNYPIVPLPTQWWQTPVTGENVQNWAGIMGPWLGFGSVTFASTGGYNATGNLNPYTQSVMSGHILWTKPWTQGGVVGGVLGGNEISGCYWSTSQYWPKYAPVVIDGIMYSTWYAETTGYTNGIIAVNLYTGATLWVINTTTTLRCGYVPAWKTINAYGAVGPYIWTTGTLPPGDTGGHLIPNTGTQWNMYSGFTGKYVGSIVNGTSATLTEDDNGHIIGYYLNSTAGTQITYGEAAAFGTNPVSGSFTVSRATTGALAVIPDLVCWNMSRVFTNIGSNWGWSPSVNGIWPWRVGIMWGKPLPNATTDTGSAINQGGTNNPTLAINGITGNAVFMTAGYMGGQGTGGEQAGWLLAGAMDATNGAVLWARNLTYPAVSALLPWTRTGLALYDGVAIISDVVNWNFNAINVRTGAIAWSYTLTGLHGALPNVYDNFGIATRNGRGVMYVQGLGGDIWCVNNTNGHLVWYTNTTTLLGNPGVETPYGVWPLWIFGDTCQDNDMSYIAVGHEYDPPLFHGAQLIALNATNGKMVWSVLDFSCESTEISYGIILSRNMYDNQIYALGKGPSATTVTAPNIGVTTATPITITGTVLDVSPGTKQTQTAANFPYGVPCVSDESESHFMEYVYEQQPAPANTTGVPVSLTETDHNGNTYTIGTTRTNALGVYGFTWTPPIEGNYTVVATFAGSNSYWGSSASTYVYAGAAASPYPTAAPPVTGLVSWNSFELGITLIIIVIVVIGAVLAMLMMRKRPM